MSFDEYTNKKNESAVGRRLICVRPLEGYTTKLGIYKIEKYLPDTKRFVITDDNDKECHALASRFLHAEQFGWWIRNHPITDVEIMFFVSKTVHLLEWRDSNFKQEPSIKLYSGDHPLGREIKIQLNETSKEEPKCDCPEKKNDGSPFDGVSYYCPIHGR
jgi:hypothetical protein